MANETIPNLPPAIALTGSELIEVVQGGVNKRTTVLAVGTGGLTLPLPIAQGGTGETTAPEAIEALLPAYAGNANKVLAVNATADGIEWDTISGAGDVVGPASATDNAVARFDLTTGKLIQNSLVTIGDSGNISAPADATISTLTVGRGGQNGTLDTAVGFEALSASGGATNLANTAIGYHAGRLLFNPRNVAIGAGACAGNGESVDNVMIGYQAYLTGNGRECVVIGQGAMSATTSGLAQGNANTVVGRGAFSQYATGAGNTFVGHQSATQTRNSQSNCFFGADAGTNHITGDYNVFVGVNSGHSGSYTGNICLGYNSGIGLTGNGNVCIGQVTGAAGVNSHMFFGTGGAEYFRVTDGKVAEFQGAVKTPALTTPVSAALTIASGVITVTGGFHTVDTEGGAGTDDLDTINGGVDGRILVLMAANGSRDVVVKNSTGNIKLNSDFTMDTQYDTLTLMYVNSLSLWVEISRSNNV
jgi:hypothetical protein